MSGCVKTTAAAVGGYFLVGFLLALGQGELSAASTIGGVIIGVAAAVAAATKFKSTRVILAATGGGVTLGGGLGAAIGGGLDLAGSCCGMPLLCVLGTVALAAAGYLLRGRGVNRAQ